MRVVKIPVQTHLAAPEPKPKKHRLRWLYVLLAAATSVQLLRPVPAPTAILSVPASVPAAPTAVALPAYGQSAVAAKGYGMLETRGAQTQLSTASIAKVITALCVLERKPLKPGEKGPLITMTRADSQFLRDEIEHNGSRVDIYEGQKMSEYQAIQALMIPSANNIANTLAVWAFGSLDAYQTYANNYVMRQGLVNTRIGSDASGYDPSTVSSASDLTRLGLLAESNPVLLEIATQTEATFPLSGTMTNYNRILGQHGITGLKTGNNDQNPGAFLMTGSFDIAGRKIQYSGAVMGAATLSEALASSRELAASLPANFERQTVAAPGRAVASYKTPWGASGKLRATREAAFIRWKGDEVRFELQNIERTSDGKYASHLTAKSGGVTITTPLASEGAVGGPPLLWRLMRL